MIEVRPPIKVALVDLVNPIGCEAWSALSVWDKVEMCLAVDHSEVGRSMRELSSRRGADLNIEPKLGEAIDRVKVDVMVDFGNHAAAAQHALTALKRGVIPIVGVMLTATEMRDIREACAEAGKPALVAPTFSVGATLLQRFTREAAIWLPDADIVECNSDPRHEVPALAAKLAAEAIAASAEHSKVPRQNRDGDKKMTWLDVPIHSVRNSGLCTTLSVVFGTTGESLKVEHASQGGTSWVGGLKVAISEIIGREGLIVGLDRLLFPE